MASEVDWGSLGGRSEGGGRSSKYLLFEADKVVNVRLVGQAVEFIKFYFQDARRCLYFDIGDKDSAASAVARVTGQEIRPQRRYAVNVIDRADGRIKILEGGWSIFKFVANWSKIHDNAHPGGKAGVDWTISVEGNGLDRRYTTMPDRPTPFTPEEVAMIKKEGSLHPLKEHFKSTAVDQIGEALEALKNEGKESSAGGGMGSESKVTSAEPEKVGAGLSDNPDDWF